MQMVANGCKWLQVVAKEWLQLIQICRTKDGIKVLGHANYNSYGKDIVCAGISALAQTLIQSMEELTEDKIEYSMKPGRIVIKFWSLSDKGRCLLDSFFIGVNLIAETYPANVKVL